jgi:hypothetical protein
VKKRFSRGYRVLAVAAAALIVAGGTVAVAGAAHRKGHKKIVLKTLVRAGVHADVSILRADGSTDAFTIDRGRVTAASSTSITLQRRDGKSVTLALSSSTKVHGTIKNGRPALVFSRNGTAFRVRAPRPFIRPAAPVAPAAKKARVVHADISSIRADGSTDKVSLDRGQVTASSTSSLTVKREDGKSVTFSIDAKTRTRGKLAVGGKALVLSRGGVAVRILARAGA